MPSQINNQSIGSTQERNKGKVYCNSQENFTSKSKEQLLSKQTREYKEESHEQNISVDTLTNEEVDFIKLFRKVGSNDSQHWYRYLQMNTKVSLNLQCSLTQTKLPVVFNSQLASRKILTLCAVFAHSKALANFGL